MKIGEIAENFVLKDQNSENFQMKDYGGMKILLSFHPLAWTSVCAEQMKSLERNHERFKELDTTAVGISIDSIPCKKARSLGIKD